MQHGRVHRVIRIAAREQPMDGPRQPPVGAQDAEQLRRQHDVAVLAALALLDADHHPAAVDVGDLEAHHLRDTQSGGIGGGQRGASFQARHRLEEAHDLVGTEHHRQLARLARMRDPLRQVGLAQRDAIKEAQGTDGLVQRRPRYAASNQMHLEGAHVLQVKPIWRAAEEAAELGHRMHVGSLGCRRQIADRHVLDHAAAQRAHLGHRGSPVSGLGCTPRPWQTEHPEHSATADRFSRVSGLVQSLPCDNPASFAA